jgi:hypothetical protein
MVRRAVIGQHEYASRRARHRERVHHSSMRFDFPVAIVLLALPVRSA